MLVQPLFETATVIGSTGSIGTSLVQRLKKYDIKINTPSRANISSLKRQDLGVVFYCIGKTANFSINPIDTVNAHVNIASKILTSCNYHSFIYLSSTRLNDLFYMEKVQLAKAVKEEDHLMLTPSNSRHLYDLSKALGECMCYQLGNDKATVVRLSCVWDLQNDVPGFLNSLLKEIVNQKYKANQDKVIRIQSDPRLSRHYVHMEDVLNSLIKIANHRESLGTVALASDSIPTKNEEIQKAINSILPVEIAFDSIIKEQEFLRIPKTPYIDISKFKALASGSFPIIAFQKHLGESFKNVFDL